MAATPGLGYTEKSIQPKSRLEKTLKFCQIHPINLIRCEIEEQQDGY